MKTSFLRTVRVIAPSGVFDRDACLRGVEALSAFLEVRVSEDMLHRKERYLAGTDEERCSELVAALQEPGVDALWCARGGYGATRLLPQIPIELVKSAARPVIGFSDITALHALWQRADVPSFHAPMVSWLGKHPQRVESTVASLRSPPDYPVLAIVPGTAEGRLAGGNLAVLAALCGTDFLPSNVGRIVFLEDVGEAPYRIDRMLTQLVQSGYFAGASAVVLGQFTNCGEPKEQDAVFHNIFVPLGLPCYRGLPCGHGSNNGVVELGTRYCLADGLLQPTLE